MVKNVRSTKFLPINPDGLTPSQKRYFEAKASLTKLSSTKLDTKKFNVPPLQMNKVVNQQEYLFENSFSKDDNFKSILNQEDALRFHQMKMKQHLLQDYNPNNLLADL